MEDQPRLVGVTDVPHSWRTAGELLLDLPVRAQGQGGGEAVEHPGEDEVGQGDRRLGRLADRVTEVLGSPARGVRAVPRVDEHDGTEGLSTPPHGVVGGVSERSALHRRADTEPAKHELLHGILQLAHGPVRMLHRDGAQPEQPARRGGAVGCDAAVRRVDSPGGALLVRRIVMRRHRSDDLDVDAHVVEVGEVTARVDDGVNGAPAVHRKMGVDVHANPAASRGAHDPDASDWPVCSRTKEVGCLASAMPSDAASAMPSDARHVRCRFPRRTFGS